MVVEHELLQGYEGEILLDPLFRGKERVRELRGSCGYKAFCHSFGLSSFFLFFFAFFV